MWVSSCHCNTSRIPSSGDLSHAAFPPSLAISRVKGVSNQRSKQSKERAAKGANRAIRASKPDHDCSTLSLKLPHGNGAPGHPWRGDASGIWTDRKICKTRMADQWPREVSRSGLTSVIDLSRSFTQLYLLQRLLRSVVGWLAGWWCRSFLPPLEDGGRAMRLPRDLGGKSCGNLLAST